MRLSGREGRKEKNSNRGYGGAQVMKMWADSAGLGTWYKLRLSTEVAISIGAGTQEGES